MPHGNTTFQKFWLEQIDGNGHELSQWCQELPSSKEAVYCIVCQKPARFDNRGVGQLIQHAKGAKHIWLASGKLSKKQAHMTTSKSEKSASTSHASAAHCYPKLVPSEQDLITRAEVLWALEVASKDESFSSCDGKKELFEKMFPGSVSAGFTMGQTKVGYLIREALGPYFKKQICEDVSSSETGYVIMYDETTTAQCQKQCDILVRYWTEKGVTVNFLKAEMFGHAKGKDVASKILCTIEEDQLPMGKLLGLSSDGPNVNKTVWREVNEKLKDIGFPGLMSFLPCNLHIIHNAFRKGLDVYGAESENLAIELFYWFKVSAARREDWMITMDQLGLDEKLFVRHVQSRWLSLLPALERITDRWDATKVHFLTELPKLATQSKTLKQLEENERYKKIAAKLRSNDVLIQLHFLCAVAPIFQKMLTLLQKEEPLVHVLHDEMASLVKQLMMRYIKQGVIRGKTSKELVTMKLKPEDNLPDKDMMVGTETKVALAKLGERQKFTIKKMRDFHAAIVRYLLDHLPLGSELLKDLQCLHPAMQSRETTSQVRRVATKMPQVLKKEEIDLVCEEWKMYQLSEIPKGWSFDKDGAYERVDVYWRKVFSIKEASGAPKFSILPKLVKSALCLAHGNADVERSLSANKQTVSNQRVSLTAETINSLRTVKDVVKCAGGPCEIAIPSTLLKAAREAHSAYQERLKRQRDEERKKKEEEARKEKEKQDKAENAKRLERKRKTLHEEETLLSENIKQNETDQRVASKLLAEANNRLAKALSKKNYEEAAIAQGLLETATQKFRTAQQNAAKCNKERSEIDAKKCKILDRYKDLTK